MKHKLGERKTASNEFPTIVFVLHVNGIANSILLIANARSIGHIEMLLNGNGINFSFGNQLGI